MNKTYFKALGNHEYGWYAYAEDDIFVLGDDYPHEGGELYRGEFKENNIPYIDKFKKVCPEAYDNAVKYFNNRLKKVTVMRENVENMEWVSILDALPEPPMDVLVCCRGGDIEILTYKYNRLGRPCFMYLDECGYWQEQHSPCVLYWMPLPEPPNR